MEADWKDPEEVPVNRRVLLRTRVGDQDLIVIGGYNDPHQKRVWDWSTAGWSFEFPRLDFQSVEVTGWMELPRLY